MNSGATSERVFDALKRRVIAGVFRPGERLDPARLGEDLHSSATPVRDALHVLVGEGLVETRTGDGFHLATIDAPALEDLYEWNAALVLLALRAWPANWRPPAEGGDDPGALVNQADARLFARVATGSPNAEHQRSIRSVNDRLEAIRIAEDSVFPDRSSEIEQLAILVERGDRMALRPAIAAYHRRRRRAAAEIVRAVYRPL